jgi:hypothetical protein
MRDAGHGLVMQAPDRTASLITSFISAHDQTI